ATGEAVSLVCVDEKQLLRDIERLIKREIPREVIAGFEPDPNAKPEPIQQRRGQQPRGGGGNGGGGGGNRAPRAGGAAQQPGAKRDGQAPKPKAAAKPRPQGGGNGNGARPSGGNGARAANGNAAHPNRNRSSRSGQRGH
ncbi:RNA helicase, partial [Burkholderia multivorans]